MVQWHVEVAAERGAPPAQVALAWLLSRPGVTAPIVGATRLGHITDALAAGQLTLTEEEDTVSSSPMSPTPSSGTANGLFFMIVASLGK